jgi:hypothetical protein
MSEKTKVTLYTILLLAIFATSFVYANHERESCESNGGVYARQSMTWSYECIITDPAEVKP